MNEQVQDFTSANDRSPVISGSVLHPKKRGAIYELENGTLFKLTRDECKALPEGYPKWKGINP